MSRESDLPKLDPSKKYKTLAKRVKEIVNKIDPDAKVFVFRPVARGKFASGIDIDILIVTEKNEATKYRILVEVYSGIKGAVEIHFATHEQFRKWYVKFIKQDKLEEID